MTLAARLDDLEMTLEHMLMDVFEHTKDSPSLKLRESRANQCLNARGDTGKKEKQAWKLEGAVETLRKTGRTRLSVAGQQTQDAHRTDTGTHTMVVQAAVTPGRSRRLFLKLPVGTLRRNSEDRLRLQAALHCMRVQARARRKHRQQLSFELKLLSSTKAAGVEHTNITDTTVPAEIRYKRD
ncbi:hypothetical protein E1301_Tti008790 [Triplophysa tibetana]|uniref:Uncharacterized protein n=1 Tax=Triplophysa tibetana TaxID=1572043 RepID=A0A5A9P285_9TELE|nr:hypothetical protein E1301_Tti008790 [Triplophysa tibetana]